jgi:hypothetical protein
MCSKVACSLNWSIVCLLVNSFELDFNSWYHLTQNNNSLIFNKSSHESNLLKKSLLKKNPLKKTKPHKITVMNHVQKRKKTSSSRKSIANSIFQTASFYYLASLLCLVPKPMHPKVSKKKKAISVLQEMNRQLI